MLDINKNIVWYYKTDKYLEVIESPEECCIDKMPSIYIKA